MNKMIEPRLIRKNARYYFIFRNLFANARQYYFQFYNDDGTRIKEIKRFPWNAPELKEIKIEETEGHLHGHFSDGCGYEHES